VSYPLVSRTRLSVRCLYVKLVSLSLQFVIGTGCEVSEHSNSGSDQCLHNCSQHNIDLTLNKIQFLSLYVYTQKKTSCTASLFHARNVELVGGRFVNWNFETKKNPAWNAGFEICNCNYHVCN
jgi:hypothetical protein